MRPSSFFFRPSEVVMRKILPALGVLAMAAAGLAQDGVRLRSGKYLSGTVSISEEDKEGFEVRRWDGAGSVYVRWTQISDAERARLLGIPFETAVTAALIDAVRIVTASREVVGVLVKEEAGQIHVKTKKQKQPEIVPASAVMLREKVRIPESEAYSPDEMVDMRVEKIDPTNADALLETAEFAASLKLYERAKELLQKAAAADPARKDYFDRRIAENETLIKEAKAAAALAAVRKLMEEMEYPKAVEEARKFLSEYGDTDLGKQNKDLLAILEKESKDFEVRRAEVLKSKVPEMWKAKRASLLSQYSSAKYKLSEARSNVHKIDTEIAADLAKKFKVSPEEITRAWELRDPKPRTVSYGSGSWIAKGGQDGGLDTDAKYDPRQNQPQQSVQNNPFFPFGGFGGTSRRRQPQQQKPIVLGQKLQTSEEWWQTASSSDRRSWLEAEYANTSQCVKKVKEDTRKCPDCAGEGVFRANRMGVNCEVKCKRCHGVMVDLIIQYY